MIQTTRINSGVKADLIQVSKPSAKTGSTSGASEFRDKLAETNTALEMENGKKTETTHDKKEESVQNQKPDTATEEKSPVEAEQTGQADSDLTDTKVEESPEAALLAQQMAWMTQQMTWLQQMEQQTRPDLVQPTSPEENLMQNIKDLPDALMTTPITMETEVVQNTLMTSLAQAEVKGTDSGMKQLEVGNGNAVQTMSVIEASALETKEAQIPVLSTKHEMPKTQMTGEANLQPQANALQTKEQPVVASQVVVTPQTVQTPQVVQASQTVHAQQESQSMSNQTSDSEDTTDFNKASERFMQEMTSITHQEEQPIRNAELVHIKVGENTELAGKQLAKELGEKIASKMLEGQKELDIQLEPANLGKIHLKMSFSEGGVSVTLSCNNAKTQELLSEHTKAIGTIVESNLNSETRVQMKEESGYWNQEKNQNGQRGNEKQDQNHEPKQKESESDSGDFIQQLRLGLIS